MSYDLTLETVSITEIRPDPGNPRTHGKKQIRKLADSIATHGFSTPITINAEGMILCGHGRWQAASLLEMTEVPVIRVTGLSPEAERALALADNRIARDAGWDLDLLKIRIGEIEAAGLNLELTGFAMGEIDLMLTGQPNSDDNALPTAPVVPVTRVGDIWICGNHRIGCGDLLDGTSLQSLMAGDVADAVIADAPYNVPINGFANAHGRHAEFAMASGEMSPSQFRKFLCGALKAMIAHSRDGAVHYLFMDWRHIDDLIRIGRRHYGAFLNLCVWNKSNAGMGSLYRSKHELIAVFRVGGEPHFNAVELGRHGRNRSNVFDYASVNTGAGSRREDLDLHPTVKPVALVADAICDVTRRGEIVLDGFLGSGTVLIACERTGRRARGLEIEPAYVDIAIKRWIAVTGQEPVLEATGETFSTRRKAIRVQETVNGG